MNEVKTPRKPLLYYYIIILIAVMLFNFLAMLWLVEHQIRSVDYNIFVSMVEDGEAGRVEIQEQDNRILFTDKKEKTAYKTAMVPDDDLRICGNVRGYGRVPGALTAGWHWKP